MSIKDVNDNVSSLLKNVQPELKEISSLDAKVQTLVQKIVPALQELKSVKAELKTIKPVQVDEKTLKSEGWSEEYIRFILRTEPQPSPEIQDRISDLQVKKETLKTFIDANNHCLSHYEQQLKKCISLFHQNHPSFKADEISVARELYKSKGIDIQNTLIKVPQRGIGLIEMVSLNENTALVPNVMEERSQRIFERAMSCPRIKNLYLEAMVAPCPGTGVTGPWRLWLTDNKTIGRDFTALCSNETRCIMINTDQSDDDILSCFVFELTNAVSSQRFEPLMKAAEEGKISREDYARSIEQIEHEGSVRHHSIMRHAINEMGWDPAMDRFKDFPKDFGDWWLHYKNGPHAENLRQQWDFISSQGTKNETTTG